MKANVKNQEHAQNSRQEQQRASTASRAYDPGRVPPQNIEAEQSVLGAMLLGDRASIETAAEMLTRKDFYREAHEHIFEAILHLNGRGDTVDAVTLKNELIRREVFDLIGGAAYVMTLGDVVPTTASIAYYAKIVQDKATARRLIEAGAYLAGLGYSDPEDVSAAVDDAEKHVLSIARGSSDDTFTRLSDLMSAECEAIEARENAPSSVTGIDTGYTCLNEITAGFQKSDLVLLAARPSMGKTACAVQSAVHAARSGKVAAVFSLEMSRQQLAQRIICSEAKVDGHAIRTGRLRPGDWEDVNAAVGRLWEAELWIDDTSSLPAQEMRARLRRLKARRGLDLVVVDYLQLMRGAAAAGRGRGYENKNQEVTEIAQSLKALAKDFHVPVLALSQLSRAVERRDDKRPMLSDLRESGSLEQEADVVAFLYRPAYYEKKKEAGSDTPPRGAYQEEDVEVIIAKQRNGPTGFVKLGFLPQFARFENLSNRAEGF